MNHVTFPLRKGIRAAKMLMARQAVRILPSVLIPWVWSNPLFDRKWYLEAYPDVVRKGAHPERHYRRHGAAEGRDPNRFFKTRWYLDRNPDVAASGMNPLDHYHLYGAAEGRDPSSLFDSDWYLASNAEVRASGIDPLLHFLRWGEKEGRAPRARPLFPEERRGVHIDGTSVSRLMLVVHDAHNHGAQQNALHLAKVLHERFHIWLDIVLLGDGQLKPEFERHARVHDFAHQIVDHEDRTRFFSELRADGVSTAICNTTISGALAPALRAAGFRVITLVHELPGIIHEYHLEAAARDTAEHSDAVVFASEPVRVGFEGIGGPLSERAHIRPQGLYKRPHVPDDVQAARAALRAELGIPQAAPIVLAVGWADARKGVDLFVDVLAKAKAMHSDAAFVWLGCEDPPLLARLARDARAHRAEDSLRLLPRVADVGRYYSAADLLVLPSREDPFPAVVLEAMSYGLPVIAFEGATGAGELLRRGCGVLVPYLDAHAMARAVVELLADPQRRTAMGSVGRHIVEVEYDWLDYVYFLLDLAGTKLHSVSVVVPNYDYAPYLAARLESVFGQTYPVRDVTFLDDASTDASLRVVEALRRKKGWELDVVPNAVNSGSVSRQWLRGAELARGDLIWIAEADDFAEPGFLSRVVSTFDDDRVVMAYSESRQVDAAGHVMANDYLDYVSDIDAEKWTRSWTREGIDEVVESLAIRNTIPNASAVVFRKSALLSVLRGRIDEISTLRVAHDYATYAHLMLDGGRISFVAEPLNNHRRHGRSVTMESYGLQVVSEIAKVQGWIRSRIPIPAEIRDQASRYLLRLCDQFGLPPDTVENGEPLQALGVTSSVGSTTGSRSDVV